MHNAVALFRLSTQHTPLHQNFVSIQEKVHKSFAISYKIHFQIMDFANKMVLAPKQISQHIFVITAILVNIKFCYQDFSQVHWIGFYQWQ